MNLQLMKKICSLTKSKVQVVLLEYLMSLHYKPIYTEDYIIAEGEDPICLLAHMDTVFQGPPNYGEFLYDAEKNILWSPYGSGFDDRAGVYIIIQLLEKGYRPSIIFTDKEETGGIGASMLITKFLKCPFKKCKALIQLDRAHHLDSVYYNCDNLEFEKYINSFGFKTDFGTFTDISIIAPTWGIAAVNLSVGYVDEHTSSERLYCSWCDETIEKVGKIIKNSRRMKFYKYIPYVYKINPKYHSNKSDFTFLFDKSCLMCGKPLNAENEVLIADTGDYPYKVCSECFNRYYLD